MEKRKEIKAKMAGGAGEVIVEHILSDKEMHGSCRMYAQVTIPAGSTLGYHEHHGESETYYILSGSGIYNDNGTEREVKAGDITYTPSGKGHGLKPSGSESIVFMALIIMD